MNWRSVLATGTLALAFTVSAYAQNTLTGADTAVILQVAQNHGSATLTTQDNGDPQINGTIDGLRYQIYFRNCTDHRNCEDLNFYLGFLDLEPSLEVINTWNYTKRFSRAYLDPEQDACVEMDIDLVEGVSAEYLNSQFAVWEMIVTQFAEHVGYRQSQ
jgi:hypothetical protein